MKAEIDFVGKDNLKRQITDARHLKANLAYAETVLIPKVQGYEFRIPVAIRVSVTSYEASIDVRPMTKSPTDEGSALVVADIVRLFGIRLSRQFNEYSGEFYWSGRNHSYHTELPEGEKPYSVFIGNVSIGKCEIRKIKKEVTEIKEVYEAHCE